AQRAARALLRRSLPVLPRQAALRARRGPRKPALKSPAQLLPRQAAPRWPRAAAPVPPEQFLLLLRVPLPLRRAAPPPRAPQARRRPPRPGLGSHPRPARSPRARAGRLGGRGA